MRTNRPLEYQMLFIREYQERLRRDAELSRTQRRTLPGGDADGKRVSNVQGLRLKLGRLMIVVGTTLQEEERPCPDLVRS